MSATSGMTVSIYDFIETSNLHFIAIIDTYAIISGRVTETLVISEFDLTNGVRLILSQYLAPGDDGRRTRSKHIHVTSWRI